ncbi:MAG: aldehyde ferredoxin oxidoreductase [Deltaproteobacteria bacterium]|nr:aldehyde ferredoxin oxidoreductase [Deltaproteobacteria bacterium]
MNGWHGKILHINLTKKESSIERPDHELYYKFIGGKGLSGYYLRKCATKEIDSDGMAILFFTGPLVGTTSPSPGRINITSISPLTGTIGDTSVGGKFGSELKKTGFDGIVITGKSDELCGIEIIDEKVSFKACDEARDLKISEVLKKLSWQGSVAAVGPSAFNGVLYSNIMIDGHYAAGRNGLGFICGIKNLKYLAVKGSKKTSIADKTELKKAREDILRLVSASPVLMGDAGISKFGTGALFDLISSRRMIPTMNFKETSFEDPEKMNAFSYQKEFGVKHAGCQGCHVRCKKIAKDGRPLPEYETMSHFSALLLNRDKESVVNANFICNEYGMDTISAAATLACHSELTGEILKPETITNLLKDIGEGTCSERLLSKGSYRYAKEKGKKDLSITVKKQELPAYDPRGAYGMALSYATSTRGGCHLRAYPVSHEILRKPVATDRFSFSGKARIIKIAEDVNAMADSLTICKFFLFAASLEEYSKIYSAVTGDKKSAQDLLDCGERIFYNDRVINSLNGFSKEEDDLPVRFFKEQGSSGNNINVPPIDREDFLEARSKYYKVRGLSSEGMPTKDKVKELGLLWKN